MNDSVGSVTYRRSVHCARVWHASLRLRAFCTCAQRNDNCSTLQHPCTERDPGVPTEPDSACMSYKVCYTDIRCLVLLSYDNLLVWSRLESTECITTRTASGRSLQSYGLRQCAARAGVANAISPTGASCRVWRGRYRRHCPTSGDDCDYDQHLWSDVGRPSRNSIT